MLLSTLLQHIDIFKIPSKTCPNNIPGRRCLAGMRNTWLRKTITFLFIFRSVTIVRALAVNSNFSIHYSAGLHVVSHGTVEREYQYLVSLMLSICSFKENTRTVSCVSQYFFYSMSFPVRWLALQPVSQVHTTCSYQSHCFLSHCCSLMIPILKQFSKDGTGWKRETMLWIIEGHWISI